MSLPLSNKYVHVRRVHRHQRVLQAPSGPAALIHVDATSDGRSRDIRAGIADRERVSIQRNRIGKGPAAGSLLQTPATSTADAADFEASTTLSGATHTVVSATPSQGSCTITGSDVDCDLGTLVDSAQATVTITVEPSATGTLTADSEVSSAEDDATPADNEDSESTTVDNALGCTIVGTSGDDAIYGTNGDDVICALGGHDEIDAGNGDDVIYGGAGDDIIDGGNGSDILYGDDILGGGNGQDTRHGGAGNDSNHGETFLGGILYLFDNGNDTIYGGPGDDQLDGQKGNDTLIDHEGTDIMKGSQGNDTIDVGDGEGATRRTADSATTPAPPTSATPRSAADFAALGGAPSIWAPVQSKSRGAPICERSCTQLDISGIRRAFWIPWGVSGRVLAPVFEIIGPFTDVQTIARGTGIRELARLREGPTGLAGGESARASLESACTTEATGLPKFTGMRQTALGPRNTRSSDSSQAEARRFVVCVSNDGYSASLEPRKIYALISDPEAEILGMVRVVDESGEDYLFPQSLFAGIDLTNELAEALAV